MRPPRQIGWVISVEQWALIRRLVADGVPQRQVAKDLGVGRSTVARALASDRPPKYERAVTPTAFAPFESAVRQLLTATPEMPATVIAERVGWTGSITWFRENVRRLRPEHRPFDPSDRLTWLPGDVAQCDLMRRSKSARSIDLPATIRGFIGCQ
ncbi:MAG: Integrase catalytic region [Friedmanniella sp.]|nr:Integrase catalytic region [Friedmanniella sp.]